MFLSAKSVLIAVIATSGSFSYGVTAAGPKKLWSLAEGLENPESALFEPKENKIFVSNVAGQADQKDGKGWISVVSPDGKMLTPKWVDQLNAPKGLASDGKLLWVSDIDQVLGIDLKTAKIVHRITIAGAKFLNDVAASPKGDIFVSDMLTGKIHRVKGDKAEVFLDSPLATNPNGVHVSRGKLVIATWGKDMGADFSTKTPGTLVFVDLNTKKASTPVPPFGNLDGLEERSKNRGWLISDWIAGKVFSWDGKSKAPQVILEGLEGAADIGYDAKKDILFAPEMKSSKLHAFQL